MVRILVFNTHCVPLVTTKSHVSLVSSYVKKSVQHYHADIIALSEIFQPWVRQQVLTELGDLKGKWKASPAVNPGNIIVSSGLLILWNTDVVERTGSMHSILFTRCCQMDCFSNKGALHGPFLVLENQQPLNLIHTHLQAWEMSTCSGVRRSQFNQIQTLMDQTPRENSVVVGDFNQNPREDLFDHLQSIQTVVPTFESHFYDHAYTNVDGATISVGCIDGDYGPSDHKAVIVTVLE